MNAHVYDLWQEEKARADRLTALVVELRNRRLADINLVISHLGQIYGLIESREIDNASDYCRAAADSWIRDIVELVSKHE